MNNSPSRFLSSYRKDKVAAYLKEYNRWNIGRISSYLDRLHPQATFGDLPLAISYHIFYNVSILADPKIWPIIKIFLPNQLIKGWPEQLPPGLLLMHCLEETKNWAHIQSSQMRYPSLEGRSTARDSHYLRVYAAILSILAGSGKESIQLSPETPVRTIFQGYPSYALWDNMPTLVRELKSLAIATVTLSEAGAEELPKPKSLVSVVVSHLSRQDKGRYCINYSNSCGLLTFAQFFPSS